MEEKIKKKLLKMLQGISYAHENFSESLEDDDDFWKAWSEMHKFISELTTTSNTRRKNELMICMKNDYMYFKTNAKNIKEALSEFDDACNKAGINMDNVIYTNFILRDKDGNDIEEKH